MSTELEPGIYQLRIKYLTNTGELCVDYEERYITDSDDMQLNLRAIKASNIGHAIRDSTEITYKYVRSATITYWDI